MQTHRELSQERSGRAPAPDSRQPPGLPVREILRRAAGQLAQAGVDSARLDAEWLLMAALGWSRESVYRNLECLLDESRQADFERRVARRCLGEPAAYIAGEREFWSLSFRVGPQVLVPRPETEHLVEIGLRFCDSLGRAARVLELGTGSGAVAVSLAHERGDMEVWATDVSADALRVARTNAGRHRLGERIRFLEGDLFGAVGAMKGPFDAIVSNPPYIASEDLAGLPGGVRDWEPLLALDGGPDGMDFHRRIVAEAPRYLGPGGLLALEIGPHMAAGVRELFHAGSGFGPVQVVPDHAGRARVVWALHEGASG